MDGERKSRFVLGLDPGTEAAGWGLIEVPRPGSFRCLGLGTILLPHSLALPRRLALLQDRLVKIMKRAKQLNAECAVEKPLVWGSNDATIGICRANGVMVSLIGKAGLQFAEYGPSQWKMVTGFGGASKFRVAAFVKGILHLNEDPSIDASDACGIALYHASTLRLLPC
jgi:crossover junction endodeoxyribonuclease RuvC